MKAWSIAETKMKTWLMLLLALLALWAAGCKTYPECGAGYVDDGTDETTEQGPEEPRDPETDPPVVTDPWPSGGELADDEGYRRMSNGEVCTCDLNAPGCSKTEPGESSSVSGDGACNVKQSEGDSDCGPQWSYGDSADQQTPSICGEVFYCCAVFKITDLHKTNVVPPYNIPICPGSFGLAGTREQAMTIFHAQLHAVWKDEIVAKSNCYLKPIDKWFYCSQYPAPPAPPLP